MVKILLQIIGTDSLITNILSWDHEERRYLFLGVALILTILDTNMCMVMMYIFEPDHNNEVILLMML